MQRVKIHSPEQWDGVIITKFTVLRGVTNLILER